MIDPGGDIEVLLAAVKELGLALEQIWLTHAHRPRRRHRHAGAHARPAHRRPARGRPVLDRRAAAAKPHVRLPRRRALHADTLAARRRHGAASAAAELEVRHCPGHTPGHVVFFEPGTKHAFVGDVLFAGSIGRTDFRRATSDTWCAPSPRGFGRSATRCASRRGTAAEHVRPRAAHNPSSAAPEAGIGPAGPPQPASAAARSAAAAWARARRAASPWAGWPRCRGCASGPRVGAHELRRRPWRPAPSSATASRRRRGRSRRAASRCRSGRPRFVLAAEPERQQVAADVGRRRPRLPSRRWPSRSRWRRAWPVLPMRSRACSRSACAASWPMIMATSSSLSCSCCRDAVVEGDLAARHAEGVELLAADDVDLHFPAHCARVPP